MNRPPVFRFTASIMTLICCLLFCSIPYIQASPPQPGRGWRGIPWGASEADVIRILGNEVVKNPEFGPEFNKSNNYIPLKIPQYTLSGEPFIVYFVFDRRTSGLAAIRMQKYNPADIIRLFDSLERLLTGKYGQPERIPGTGPRKAVWNLQEMLITLVATDHSSIGLSKDICIWYNPPRTIRSDTDKL
ncbi:hypothetical protein [Chitinophaga solisilvae]|uniref:hypothetical protein n=1 Tax=Chitinophaga solisilvae TaxID=1233460 RepID=UPI001371C7A2|nr:hypothetical protein [Chitinophaga solisilvae]